MKWNGFWFLDLHDGWLGRWVQGRWARSGNGRGRTHIFFSQNGTNGLRWFDLNAIWIIYRCALPRMLHNIFTPASGLSGCNASGLILCECAFFSSLFHSNPMKLFRSTRTSLSICMLGWLAVRFNHRIMDSNWYVSVSCLQPISLQTKNHFTWRDRMII